MSDLDLGDSHYLNFYSWNPDRELNPQWKDTPDIDKCGATIEHLTPAGKKCIGSVMFNGPGQDVVFYNRTKWTVENWEPLTLSPSVLCSCGDHGFVKEGRWVRA